MPFISSAVRIAALTGLVAAHGPASTAIAAAETVSTVEVIREQLVVRAGAGQRNDIRIQQSGQEVVVSDTGLTRAGSGCSPVTEKAVVCSGLVTAVTVDLGDGDDTMSLDASPDLGFSTYGGDGNDTIDGGAGIDWLYGGDGFDTLNGGPGADHLFGGDDTDHLLGGPGEDELRGGLDMDYLFGGTEKDVIDGTDGMRDTVSYSDRSNPVTVDLATGQGGEVGENDQLLNVQDVFGGSGPDTLIGNGKPNILVGGGSLDQIVGGAGYNEIIGGPGDDVVHGGKDTDLVDGNAGNDVIYGGDGNDELSGNAGDDELHGQGGGDDLSGGDHDSSTVPPGDDCFPGGQVDDDVTTCEFVG